MRLQPIPLYQTAQGFLPDFLTSWPSQETRNLVIFILTWNPLLSMPAFHALTLEIHLPLGCVQWAKSHQRKKLPRYTSAELTRKRLQHQNKEQWAEDKTIIHTISHAKLPTVLTTDWSSCSGWHAQPIPRSRGPLSPTIGPPLAHDRSLSQGRRRHGKVAW